MMQLGFFDGWNIYGEVGDTIKTESRQVTTIQSINYDTNTLTVSPSINIVQGEGLSLYYEGSAPDIGAFEYVGDSQIPSCVEDWNCSEWGEWSSCVNFEKNQTRVCADLEQCNTQNNKPNEIGLVSCGLPQVLNKSNWSLISVDSEELAGSDTPAIYAFDDDPATFWHTKWQDSSPLHPHNITIDLGELYNLSGFSYLPRQDGGYNGDIEEYEFYASADGTEWFLAQSGTLLGQKDQVNIMIDGVVGRYVRLVSLSEVNDNPWANVAELDVVGIRAEGVIVYHDADNDPQDGCVDLSQLVDYIARWKNNEDVSMADVIDAVVEWRRCE